MSLFTPDEVEAQFFNEMTPVRLWDQAVIDEMTEEEYSNFLAGYLIHDC